MYDIASHQSFEKAQKWVEDLQEEESTVNEEGSKLIKFIVGNKIDLNEKREVSEDEGMEYAKGIPDSEFMEISVKEGTNMDTLLEALAMKLGSNNFMRGSR